jgi:hypothetical protein
MLNIDLGKIVAKLGETTIAEIGEPLGLSPELSMKAARALAENFHGNTDEAIAAAAKETGIGKEILEAMIGKLLEEARSQAVDHVKDQAATAAKGLFGRFFGR